jgi:hypothetical protein
VIPPNRALTPAQRDELFAHLAKVPGLQPLLKAA